MSYDWTKKLIRRWKMVNTHLLRVMKENLQAVFSPLLKRDREPREKVFEALRRCYVTICKKEGDISRHL